MSVVNFDLQPEWLRRHEMPRDPEILRNEDGEEMARMTSWSRNFKVSVGGDDFVLAVHHAPKPAAVMFSEIGEQVRTPSDAEVLFLLARAFLGSLPVHPEPEPDVAKGWTEFREQALETNPSRFCPPWEQLNPEWREAFAAGVRRAFEGCRREAKVTRPATREEVFADLGAMPTLPAEPDVERAWDACQRQARETLPAGYGGKRWADLLPEEREAFAVGVRAAFQPSTLNSQLSTFQP